MRYEHAITVVAARGGGEDRASVFERGNRLVIVLADGAGGTSNGAAAAQAIVDGAREQDDFAELLLDIDANPTRLHGGQSTAVIVAIDTSITGVSVGDSGAWLVAPDGAIDDLTANQDRKPLVGAGCSPCYITPTPFIGTLVVASDGLFRYARRADIVACITQPAALDAIVASLIDLVRLPSGELQDDVAIVLCRAPAQ